MKSRVLNSAGDGESVPQAAGRRRRHATGLSIEKYGREAVVKAQVGDATVTTAVTSQQTQSMTDEPLRSNFDEMTVAEMRDYAEKHDIDLGDAHLKADVAKKLKKA